MQSSGMAAGRALIMLACAVTVPALALSDVCWSAALKKVREFRWSAYFQLASTPAPPPIGSPRLLPMAEPTKKLAIAADEGPAVVPVSYEAPIEAAIPSTDPYRAAQDRLRQLGATYYLLESWGDDRQMVRFYCKMAIGGSPDYTRCFECVGREPLEAIGQVLQQVEAWRSGIQR